MKSYQIYQFLYPICYTLCAALLLFISLTTLIRRKPSIIPARYGVCVAALFLLPTLAMCLHKVTAPYINSTGTVLLNLLAVVFAVLILVTAMNAGAGVILLAVRQSVLRATLLQCLKEIDPLSNLTGRQALLPTKGVRVKLHGSAELWFAFITAKTTDKDAATSDSSANVLKTLRSRLSQELSSKQGVHAMQASLVSFFLAVWIFGAAVISWGLGAGIFDVQGWLVGGPRAF